MGSVGRRQAEKKVVVGGGQEKEEDDGATKGLLFHTPMFRFTSLACANPCFYSAPAPIPLFFSLIG